MDNGPMSERILFVDGELQVLEAIQQSLRKQADIRTATSGAEGLRLLQSAGPFALVIADMRMPSMNGAQFLAKVREQAPDTVRMILSGQSDLAATISAVNEGHIYRFLSKPCPPEQLLAAVQDGLKQYRLVTAEKVLLEQTLSGSVKMLIEILGLISPAASGRAARLQRYVIDLAAVLALPSRWQWGLAAYVSQIGCVALPKDLLSKVEAAEPLTEEERRLYDSHPEVAAKLLAAIPRLEEVAAIVASQAGSLHLAGKPEDISQWDLRSTGEALLRTSCEFDRFTARGATREAAVEALGALNLGLPPVMLKGLLSLKVANREVVLRQLRLNELAPGMILDEDVLSAKGVRLVPVGQEVTRTLIVKLLSIANGVGVAEPVRVKVPA
jgi:response regulator RpfG family c-di-GMP phosphodiesterase